MVRTWRQYKFDIVTVSETWNTESSNYSFSPINLIIHEGQGALIQYRPPPPLFLFLIMAGRSFLKCVPNHAPNHKPPIQFQMLAAWYYISFFLVHSISLIEIGAHFKNDLPTIIRNKKRGGGPIGGNIIDTISDHLPNFIIIKDEHCKMKYSAHRYQRYPKRFQHNLISEYGEKQTQNMCINELSKTILDTFVNNLEIHAPYKKLSRKETKNK